MSTHADEVPQPFMNPNILRKGTIYVNQGTLYAILFTFRRSILLYQLYHQAKLALYNHNILRDSTHYATKDTLHVNLGTLYATLYATLC